MINLAEVDYRLAFIGALALVCLWLIKRWGPLPEKDPEKLARWKALPLRFKMACWFGVMPLAVIGVVLSITLNGFAALAGIALVAGGWGAKLTLEIRAVAWYRANGYLRTSANKAAPNSDSTLGPTE